MKKDPEKEEDSSIIFRYTDEKRPINSMVVIGDKYKSTELVCVVQSRVKTMNTTHGAMGSMSLLR